MENDKTTCRTCKHRQRWMNDFSPKVTQVCELKKGRTPMGFKKIKVTDIACERYERGIDMDKIETRGGSRPGSGRKPAVQEKKRIQISISVSPETKRMIDDMRKRKVKVGQVVDELIRQYFEDEE